MRPDDHRIPAKTMLTGSARILDAFTSRFGAGINASVRFLVGALLVLLAANGLANPSPVLHTTISADGDMVATLLNAGTDQQLLRVRNLRNDTSWRLVQAPPFTRTIRFANQGHDLLLTYRVPATKTEVLARLNLDKPVGSLQKIYEASDLAFPIEVSPGQIMVRTRSKSPSGDQSTRFYLSGYHWILVGPGQQVHQVGPNPVLPYPAPNIVGSGFFWIEEQMDEKKEPHPKVLSFALPGGVAPNIARERFEKNTWSVSCDREARRCLRRHITNFQRTGGDYLYNVDVLLDGIRCKLTGIAGSSDGVSITPDGNAAVMSLSPGFGKPRHVVVMRFKPKLCEALEIQHFDFKGK